MSHLLLQGDPAKNVWSCILRSAESWFWLMLAWSTCYVGGSGTPPSQFTLLPSTGAAMARILEQLWLSNIGCGATQKQLAGRNQSSNAGTGAYRGEEEENLSYSSEPPTRKASKLNKAGIVEATNVFFLERWNSRMCPFLLLFITMIPVLVSLLKPGLSCIV